jgi:hypothetical protein
MACPGSTDLIPIMLKKIKVVKGFNPNPSPNIIRLSTYSSSFNTYTRIVINGTNFLPFGSTTVTFGPITKIPVSYLSSSNISFTLPITNAGILTKGIYHLFVVTINDKTQLVPTYLYSNIVRYVIT